MPIEPVTPSQLKIGIDSLHALVEAVINYSAPFKVKAKLLYVSISSAKVELNGKVCWINQRHCYFAMGQIETDTEVYIDNRYTYQIN